VLQTGRRKKCKKNLIIRGNDAEDVLVWNIFTTFATMAAKRQRREK
jgi:hypothetical protein